MVVGKLKGSLRSDKEAEWRQKTVGMAEKKVVRDGENHHIAKRCERK